MKCFSKLCILLLSVSLWSSCITEEQFDNTPEGNFNALWKIIDEHYCFLDYKHINWDSIQAVYRKSLTPQMTAKNQFEVFSRMLDELKDGHVNLYAAHDVGRYWGWKEDHPSNYRADIVDKYLGTGNDYAIAGGMKYKAFDDNVGYVRYESFSDGVGDGNISEVLNILAACNGLIIDIRDNPGGTLTYATRLAEHFTNERILIGYISHKTGTGHEDFSKPEAMYLDPSNSVRWQKKVVVLTNRGCFSAANDFVKAIKECKNVTVVGDSTGGGSGFPFSSELPNGWSVRFSASPLYDARMQYTEFGIAPDIRVEMKEEDLAKGRDTLIEYARELLK